jgi:hypothetical protein
LLALAAWAAYVFDRLLDTRAALLTGKPDRLRQRHYFHWRHRRVFLPLAVISACAAGFLVFRYMPVASRERNSVLAAAALAYFSGVHARRGFPRGRLKFLGPLFAGKQQGGRRKDPKADGWLLWSPTHRTKDARWMGHPDSSTVGGGRRWATKEFLVALLFTAACTLPALSRVAIGVSRQPEGPLLASVVFFTLLAWLNCHAIECWESGGEPSRGQPSQEAGIFAKAFLLAFTGLALAAVLASIHPRIATLALTGATSALLLGLLDRIRGRLTPVALRSAADVALLTPLVLVLR